MREIFLPLLLVFLVIPAQAEKLTNLFESSDNVLKGLAASPTCQGTADQLKIQELRASLAKMEELSFRDSKFPLAHSPLWMNQWLPENFQKLRSQSTTLLNIDLDRFKFINSTFGHEQADQVLDRFVRYLDQFMRDHTRDGDFYLVRNGGDEFLVIFNNVPLEKVYNMSEKLRREMATKTDLFAGLTRKPFDKVEEGQFYDQDVMTISAGIDRADHGEPQMVPDAVRGMLNGLKEVSDEALYEMKQKGRNILALSQACKKALVQRRNTN